MAPELQGTFCGRASASNLPSSSNFWNAATSRFAISVVRTTSSRQTPSARAPASTHALQTAVQHPQRAARHTVRTHVRARFQWGIPTPKVRDKEMAIASSMRALAPGPNRQCRRRVNAISRLLPRAIRRCLQRAECDVPRHSGERGHQVARAQGLPTKLHGSFRHVRRSKGMRWVRVPGR